MKDIKSKKIVSNVETQNTLKKNPKKRVNTKPIFGVMITMVSLSIFLQRLICQNWQQLGQYVFGFNKLINNYDKFTVMKKAMLYIAGFQFFIALVIMHIRIFGQYINPVGDKDPISIAVLNRVLSNTLQQSLVFFGLYAYLLFECSQRIQNKHIFALPLMFLIGRSIFAVSYSIATIIGISSFRSVGFAFAINTSMLMLELIFQHTNFLNNFLFS